MTGCRDDRLSSRTSTNFSAFSHNRGTPCSVYGAVYTATPGKLFICRVDDRIHFDFCYIPFDHFNFRHEKFPLSHTIWTWNPPNFVVIRPISEPDASLKRLR